MKEVYELWSFCIHSLRLTAPASAALVVLVDPVALAALADPVALAALADPVALVVLAALADPVALAALAVLVALVDPADPVAPVVPRPWAPRSPVWRRNSRTLAMPRTLKR